MNGYADDLATVIEALDLRDVTLVGHSTGGAEVARYVGRHGTSRVTKVVLISAAVRPEELPRQCDVPDDGLHAGPKEVRRSDPDPARGGRPDRAGADLGHEVRGDHQGREGHHLPGCAAR